MSGISTSEIAVAGSKAVNPFSKYSLNGQLEDVEKNAGNQEFILGRLALSGQATCIYAAPNTGKTLLVLRLLEDAIQGGLDPARIYYLNMDDGPDGLLTKGQLAEEYGFQMLADGYRGFTLAKFEALVKQMVAGQQVHGAVLILDTLKHFVDVMNKSQVRSFTRLVRSFVSLGGTVIALSHTNKNRGNDGNHVYAGTADIRDDFDCVYMMSDTEQTMAADKKVVVLSNIKARGKVASKVAYEYDCGTEASWLERLSSVREVDPKQWQAHDFDEVPCPDAHVIAAVKQSLNAGVIHKMALAKAVRQAIGVSRQRAMRVIEEYCAPASKTPLWKFTAGKHNRYQFELLEQPASTEI